mmetsp:Transcript_15732/g.23179  ORF Transcript_15732/g.23179 Transcript_15732/m.23179 type:complete len:116 (+) Transcript_15732:216-563(+)
MYGCGWTVARKRTMSWRASSPMFWLMVRTLLDLTDELYGCGTTHYPIAVGDAPHLAVDVTGTPEPTAIDETLVPTGSPTASPLGSICGTVLEDANNDDIGTADEPLPEAVIFLHG